MHNKRQTDEAVSLKMEEIVTGVWRRLCGQSWTLTEAQVVCRQLRLGQALQV